MTTIWVDGIEYELVTHYIDDNGDSVPYGFDVYEPSAIVDISSTGSTTVIDSEGTKIISGLLVEMLGKTYNRNESIHQISEGDTPNTVLVAGLPLGAVQNMTGDWVCTTEILDNARKSISGPRSITETLDNSEGIESFKAEMLISESALMVNEYTRNRPAGYYWLITVENEAIPFRRTLEIEIAVSKR